MVNEGVKKPKIAYPQIRTSSPCKIAIIAFRANANIAHSSRTLSPYEIMILATTPEVNGDTTEASAASPKTKTPFKLVNEHQRSSKNKITNEELLSEFGTFCMELAESPKQCCKKCCLRCLADESASVPVSLYLLQFAKKHVTTRDQTLVD